MKEDVAIRIGGQAGHGRSGKTIFPTTGDHTQFPNERIQVAKIGPSQVEFKFEIS